MSDLINIIIFQKINKFYKIDNKCDDYLYTV
jgi:hypothetical protein